jgi:SagB-type dehydrogenase family enzyme
VLEARRSKREYGERPLTLDQLGEFLYRAARVQKAALDAGVSFRPHPAGGALHELEIYPVVSRGEGLPAGLYHYDAYAHGLERIAEPNRSVEALLQMAAVTGTIEAPLQVLLVITARFQRIQWKYRSMCYALILKNVGALYQTMYLVATAMGLAPTALGGGHSDLFASAAGLDYLAETSVGEFVLGSGRA